MADIVRSDPFGGIDRDFGNLRRMMERVFDDSMFRLPAVRGGLDEGSLELDVFEQDGKVVVKASLPGFNKEDVDVQVHEGVLSIKAEHTEEHEEKDAKYYRRERRWGSVARRVALPGVVAEADVNAELKDGVLTVTVPVPEKAKPKQIEIKG
ncbi:MAG: Hsp20/alpha crystallin family protein [Dehalococcoidia bacterium]